MNPREHSVSRRFLGNTALNYAGQGLSLILVFVTAPYIVHHLGPELYGIVAMVQVTAGLSGMLNLGIGKALTKYVSELFWKNDVEEINRLFQTTWASCLVTGLIAMTALIGPKDWIERLFFRGGFDVSQVAGFAIYIAAFGLFSSMLLEAMAGVPVALQRFDIFNGVNVLTGMVRNIGPVILLAMGYGIRSVLIVLVGANLLAVASFMTVSCRLIPGLSPLPRFSRPAFKKLFSFSLPLLFSEIFVLVINRADRFILAYYLPLAAVTFYTLPYAISEKLSMGVANITSVVFPFTSELHSMGCHDKVQELYLRSIKILMLATMPMTAILLALPEPILRFWLGKEYAQQGALVLGLLGIATLLTALSAVPTATSLGLGNARIPATFACASCIVNLASNLILIPRYGIDGAAMASLLPQALVVPPFVYVVTRMVRLSHWELFTRGLCRPLLCAAAQFVALCAFRRYIESLLGVAVLSTVSLLVFAVLALFGAITRDERSALLRLSALRLSARMSGGAESQT